MTRSRVAAVAGLLFAGLAVAASVARAEAPPAAPERWVTDAAGFLSEGTRQEVDGQLEAYEKRTGHQVLVWIGRTTGGVPVEDFAARAFGAWHVGRKSLDDGLVLFVFSDDRAVRVEVGYGLEGLVPDAIASRIIRETIVPRVQAGDRDGAIREGVGALILAIEGSVAGPLAASGPRDNSPPARAVPSLSLGQKVLIGLAVLAFLVLLATNPSLALYLLFTAISGGRGGGGGGGGGYSGGGGRSGGGGASGSW